MLLFILIFKMITIFQLVIDKDIDILQSLTFKFSPSGIVNHHRTSFKND